MTQELTVEQEDELLRADIFAAESGTNDSEGTEETVTEEAEPESTTETVEPVAEEPAPEDNAEPPKKKSNVAKILAEKNEYKREAMEAKKRVEELEERLSGGEVLTLKDLDSVVDKRIAEKMEVQDFFSRNPEAMEHKVELDAFREENPNLSYDRAYKFFLAETNPQALLDEQTNNKTRSNIYSTAGRTPPALRQEKKDFDYSDAELDTLIKAGKIKL